MSLFIPEMQVLLWSVVVFASLTGLLWRFAWGPLLRALEERENRIARRIEATEAALAEAKAKAAEHDRRLLSVKDEALAVLAEAKRDAEHLREEILTAAQAEANRSLERAKREIGLAKEAAIEDLRQQMVTLTGELAAQVIGREVKPDDHRRFIEDGVARLGQQSRN